MKSTVWMVCAAMPSERVYRWTASAAYGNALIEIFEEVAETQLIQPTFMTGYPIEVSPLARKNDQNPTLVDRFELYIGGRELANAFSELNDPADQRQRFLAQMEAHKAGDDTANPDRRRLRPSARVRYAAGGG